MFQAFNGVKSLKEVNAEVVAVNEDTLLSREASKVDASEVFEYVRVKFEEETKEDVDKDSCDSKIKPYDEMPCIINTK